MINNHRMKTSVMICSAFYGAVAFCTTGVAVAAGACVAGAAISDWLRGPPDPNGESCHSSCTLRLSHCLSLDGFSSSTLYTNNTGRIGLPVGYICFISGVGSTR